MMRLFLLLFFVLLIIYHPVQAQNANPEDYYHQIPDYPDNYTATNVAARLVDGLGFRYYWASEGLQEQDLAYRPSEQGRSMIETLQHICGLTITILNAVQSKPNTAVDIESFSYAELRERTLENIKAVSETLKSDQPDDMEGYRVIFPRLDGSTLEFPFWNMINGPITDAVYHTGQIVTFRRTTGNPINPNISVLRGRLRGE